MKGGPKYYQVKSNGRGYSQPPRDMRDFFDPIACGRDGPKARALARRFARTVEKKRKELKTLRKEYLLPADPRKKIRTFTIVDIASFARNYAAKFGTPSERHAIRRSEILLTGRMPVGPTVKQDWDLHQAVEW